MISYGDMSPELKWDSYLAPEVDSRHTQVGRYALGGSQTLTTLAIESSPKYLRIPEFVPKDWEEQVDQLVSECDVVSPAYFIPEVRTNMKHVWPRSQRAEAYNHIDTYLKVYSGVAASARNHFKPVAAADMANRVWFGIVDARSISGFLHKTDEGPHRVTPSAFERVVPTTVDARRMQVAKGIVQTARRHPEWKNILYVAAPAHVNRVVAYLSRKPRLDDLVREQAYADWFPSLLVDQKVREFVHTGAGWERVRDDPIRTSLRQAAAFGLRERTPTS